MSVLHRKNWPKNKIQRKQKNKTSCTSFPVISIFRKRYNMPTLEYVHSITFCSFDTYVKKKKKMRLRKKINKKFNKNKLMGCCKYLHIYISTCLHLTCPLRNSVHMTIKTLRTLSQDKYNTVPFPNIKILSLCLLFNFLLL